MSRKPWPSKRPLPHFASGADEFAFWEAHDVLWDDEAESAEVPGPVVAIQKPKTIIVTLSANDEARLSELAKQQRVSKKRALEGIIGGALRTPARVARRKRTANA